MTRDTINRLKSDKTQRTWLYILTVFVVGGMFTIHATRILTNMLGLPFTFLNWAVGFIVVGWTSKLLLHFKLNLFNSILYDISLLLCRIGYFMLLITVGYFICIENSLSFVLTMCILFIVSVIFQIITHKLPTRREKVFDKEERIIHIYDKWETLKTTYKKADTLIDKYVVALLMSQLIEEDEKYHTNVVNKEDAAGIKKCLDDINKEIEKAKQKKLEKEMNKE